MIGRWIYCVGNMHKWFNIFEVMSTYQEGHAFVEGFCDGFLFLIWWVDKHKPNKELTQDICNEHHYYRSGAVLGVASFILFCVGISKLAWHIKDELNDKVYTAFEIYRCARCGKSILPGAEWRYDWIDYKIDTEGHKIQRLGKVHSKHSKAPIKGLHYKEENKG